jgi:hypothetical protein
VERIAMANNADIKYTTVRVQADIWKAVQEDAWRARKSATAELDAVLRRALAKTLHGLAMAEREGRKPT